MTVKKTLQSRGYRFPRPFKDANARAKFVGKYGYDPHILLNAARRVKDGAGPGWENAFPPQGKRGKSRGKG